jgi:SAM-dependent methyltransferase
MSQPDRTAAGGRRHGHLSAWEAAYLRFESPEEEIRKFRKRLLHLGADRWPIDARIVELFCGRGNGLRALTELGFRNLEGIDLSLALASRYGGPGTIVVGDCRTLPFGDSSRDVLIVQGGLHHLIDFPADLDRTLLEARRVLRSGGRFVVVEPWLTSFLRVVHLVCRQRLARSVSSKIDALATMIENEQTTYDQWLSNPVPIRRSLRERFEVETESIAWGKLMFVGRRR